MQTTTKLGITLTALAMSLGSAHITMAQAIGVQVNGTAVQFQGTQPIEQNGAVLVPLRGVFEAMGASVNYDPYSHTIYAHQGNRNVTLPLGATVATVDGQQQTLSQPAQVVGGTTLVPLRFVAEALGSYVEWQSASNTVLIQANGNTSVAYAPDRNSHQFATNTVTGVIRSITTDQIVLHSNGSDQTFAITDQTTLVQPNTTNPTMQIAWNDLAPGDFVKLHTQSDGEIISVAPTYGTVTGRVSELRTMPNGSREIVLRNGTIVPLSHDVTISKDGNSASFGDLTQNDRVSIRTNPNNDRGYDVMAGTIYAHRR
jgi:hypothetical protein